VRIPTNMSGAVAAAAAFFLQTAYAAEAAAPRFAAPGAASSLPASGASGIGQVTFALLLVLAAVFGVAWMLKRLRAVTGAGANGIEVLAQTSLGSKERAVIVRVGDERLLLGVASGQVTLLKSLPAQAPVANTPSGATITFQKPNFAALLKKSLGR
jgi:flagellar protein FliO/FliZ